MGKITVRDLAELYPAAALTIADYDLGKAKALAKELGVTATFIDVTKPATLLTALKGAFAVINCCPYQFNLDVMQAALKSQCHYVDLGGLFHMTNQQLKFHRRFQQAGLVAVLGMGASPGLTNLLAAEAALRLDSVEEIHIRLGSSDQSRYENVPALPVAYSLKTILEEFSKPPAVFTKGKLRFVEPMSGGDPYRFPKPVGVKRPFYTLHSELATLPSTFARLGVKEVSFKIAFDDDFVTKVRFLRDLGLAAAEPVDLRGTKVSPILLVDKVAMAQKPAKRVGALKQHEIVRAIVKGKRGSSKRTVFADCHTVGVTKWNVGSDANTGCPPSIAVQLIAEGKILSTGALPPEKVFLPKNFFAHLKPRGMWVEVKETAGWKEKT